MAYNKGNHGSSGGNRGRPCALMLLLAFGVALLGVMVLHKLRERRIYNLLLKEKDRQLLALQLLLQKERDHTKEMKRKNEEMKGKIHSLRSQKIELERRVQDMHSIMDSLKEEQKVMESTLEEKQNKIRMLQEKGSNLGKENPEVVALTEHLKQKEAELVDLKHRFEVPFKSRWVSSNDSTNLPESVSASGKMAVQDKTQNDNKGRDEQSHESTKYGDGKGITNEDASKSKLTKSKDGEVTDGVEDEIQVRKGNNDRLIETDKHIKRQETLRVEGVSVGGTAGEKMADGEQRNIVEYSQHDDGTLVTAKETDEKIVDGKENATIRGGQREQFENNTDDGGPDFNFKQLSDNSKIPVDVKRKHDPVSRTKGKRWRTILKNKLLGNNGISESHGAVNMRSRKVNRYEHELKDRRVGRLSNDENIEREEEEMGNNNPSKDKAEAKLPRPGNHDDIQDAKIKIVNDTNHQVTESGIGMHPGKQRLNELRQSEKQEDSGVKQSRGRRQINVAKKNAGHEKTGMFHEELKAVNVQQEKDTIDGGDDEDNDDDFFKESHSDIEDEKEEYKEEIDESEFQTGL